MIASLLTAAIVALHLYILVLEMFRWEHPRTRRAFGTTEEFAKATKVLAANQGLYNGFLAAACLLGLVYPDPAIAKAFALFGLACVAVAGVWGAVTVMVRILYIQTVPAVLGLAAIYWL